MHMVIIDLQYRILHGFLWELNVLYKNFGIYLDFLFYDDVSSFFLFAMLLHYKFDINSKKTYFFNI